LARTFAHNFCKQVGLWMARGYDAAENYDDDDWAFDFLPGDAGGINPVTRQLIPSIFLPFSNLIERHVMISPLEASSER
jgi:hypothetical protein